MKNSFQNFSLNQISQSQYQRKEEEFTCSTHKNQSFQYICMNPSCQQLGNLQILKSNTSRLLCKDCQIDSNHKYHTEYLLKIPQIIYGDIWNIDNWPSSKNIKQAQVKDQVMKIFKKYQGYIKNQEQKIKSFRQEIEMKFNEKLNEICKEIQQHFEKFLQQKMCWFFDQKKIFEQKFTLQEIQENIMKATNCQLSKAECEKAIDEIIGTKEQSGTWKQSQFDQNYDSKFNETEKLVENFTYHIDQTQLKMLKGLFLDDFFAKDIKNTLDSALKFELDIVIKQEPNNNDDIQILYARKPNLQEQIMDQVRKELKQYNLAKYDANGKQNNLNILSSTNFMTNNNIFNKPQQINQSQEKLIVQNIGNQIQLESQQNLTNLSTIINQEEEKIQVDMKKNKKDQQQQQQQLQQQQQSAQNQTQQQKKKDVVKVVVQKQQINNKLTEAINNSKKQAQISATQLESSSQEEVDNNKANAIIKTKPKVQNQKPEQIRYFSEVQFVIKEKEPNQDTQDIITKKLKKNQGLIQKATETNTTMSNKKSMKNKKMNDAQLTHQEERYYQIEGETVHRNKRTQKQLTKSDTVFSKFKNLQKQDAISKVKISATNNTAKLSSDQKENNTNSRLNTRSLKDSTVTSQNENKQFIEYFEKYKIIGAVGNELYAVEDIFLSKHIFNEFLHSDFFHKVQRYFLTVKQAPNIQDLKYQDQIKINLKKDTLLLQKEGLSEIIKFFGFKKNKKMTEQVQNLQKQHFLKGYREHWQKKTRLYSY